VRGRPCECERRCTSATVRAIGQTWVPPSAGGGGGELRGARTSGWAASLVANGLASTARRARGGEGA
jgi:hypothetical protein